MITIYEGFWRGMPYEERYGLIKEAGFDGVLINWGRESNEVNYRENAEMARRAGLFIENVHTSYHNINDLWLDNLNGEEVTEYLLKCVDDCHEQEIPTMIVHLTFGFDPPDVCELGVDRLRKITEKAEKKGINVALENLKRPDYLEYVFDRIDSKRLGFCFDSGHQNCHSKDIDFLSIYGDKFMSLHLHDNDGSDDQHILPFDGNIDWNYVMKKLTDIDYKGPIALEVSNRLHPDITEPMEFLALALERAKRLESLK